MSNGGTSIGNTQTTITDGASDPFDHPIFLVDATDHQTDPPESLRSSLPSKLAKSTTITSVREHLAKKKYARWQQERYSSEDQQGGKQPRSPIPREESPQIGITDDGERAEETEATDFAPQPATSGRGPKRPLSEEENQKHKHKHKEWPYEVDILYENQRGLFFFGIPLYSHSSLLNFDPAPWVTKDFKDSLVNITNAQVPDPSWEWAWKSWYVDMSYDVDEEGWQYSFSFGRKWAWHGTHPWFHSYVRRRRWLRKRVKRHGGAVSDGDGSMHAAHALSGDYFTIHPKRERSPASTLATTPRTSYTSQRALDNAPDEIDNVANLLKALRLATVDREKIDAVKQFLEQGGEELAYLEEQIPEIMSLLMFQTSKRQLVELLQREAADAKKHRDEHDAEGRPESEAESRRIDYILRAARTACGQIGGLEYWSDRKHVLQLSDETGSAGEAENRLPAAGGASAAPTENEPVEDVQGISENAELEVGRTHSTVDTDPVRSNTAGVEDKGKGKAEPAAVDDEDGSYSSFNVRESSDRMPSDAVLVPDEK